MQIYLKPYPHQTYCNVPYVSEKRRMDGTQNCGFFDVKKYPGQLSIIPELRDNEILKRAIEEINLNSNLATYGCEYNANRLNADFLQVWSYISIYFADLDENKIEGNYFNLVSNFLSEYALDLEENIVVEFFINPTNFHDFAKIKKGSKPKEETVLFRGFSMNCKIIGVAVDIIQATNLWRDGLSNLTTSLTA